MLADLHQTNLDWNVRGKTNPVGSPELPAWSEYLDLQGLSRYTSLSSKVIRKLQQDPVDPLPCVPVGRGGRYYRPAIDAWMARRAGQARAVDQVPEELRSDPRRHFLPPS